MTVEVAAARPLTAKVLPPERPDAFVRRRDLLERLDGTLRCRLATIVAGAGYGKSTLAASWARAPACVWFTCDRADRLLGTFARGLAESVRVRSSTLSEELAAVAAGSDESSRAEPLATFVCRALEDRLTEDLVLVLDDVHELGRTSGSARLLAALCRQAPVGFHLMLCSREQPPFSVERLRGRGEVLEVSAADLAFTEKEVEELLGALLGEEDKAVADRLHAVTGGWPAAVRLAIESVRAAGDRAHEIESLRGSGSPLFSYVANEVLAAQPASLRQLLRSVAPFERVDVALCEALGIERAAERLHAAVNRGLIIPLGGDRARSFTVHQLVREVVEATSPLPQSTVRELRRRSASWLERRGLLEEALRELIVLTDASEVARFLDGHGGELLSAGAVSAVVAAAELVPERIRDSGLEQLLGEAHYLLGNWEESLACFRRVAREHDVLPAALAWRLSDVLHFRGEFEESARMGGRVRLDGSHPADEARVLAMTAYAYWIMGNTAVAEELSGRAIELATASRQPEALVAAHNVAGNIATTAGRHEEAILHLARAVAEAERVHDVPLLTRARENLAAPLLAEGRYEEALDQQSRAIELAELAGFAFLQALALHSRGNTHLDLGRLDEAFADADAATRIFRSIDSGWVCVSLAGLGDVLRERGEVALARGAYEEAVRRAELVGEAPILVTARSGLARVLAREEPELAAALARRAAAQGPPPGDVVGLLAAGWVALARGSRADALRQAQEASAAARERNERAGLAEALELRALAAPDPPRELVALVEAAALWQGLRNPVAATRAEYAIARLSGARHDAERAKRTLERLGVRVESAAQAAGLLMALGPEAEVPLRIQTLGRFRVLRDGEPAATSDWQSKKARDLLKIMISRRGRPTPRDVLMDAFWPGDDASSVAKRLSVALSTIRTVLDPKGRFPSEHFVVADAEAVAVDLAHIEVDVEAFLADVSRGLAALRGGREVEALELLESAEAAYAGDYLEEDLYEDWAAPLREEARAGYVAAARALALTAAKRGDHDSAVRYRLRVVQRDPLDEEAHLGLVSALIESGRHGDARRAYRAYVARMEEVGVEPAPFTPGRPQRP